jgi:hypothetical protein
VPLRRGDRSRKEPSRINTRTVLKSATRGQPLASLRPALTAKSLSVNKLLLLGWKLKRFFLTQGNFVDKVSKYNPVTDSYQLFYPADNHEEWLSFSEVVKLVPKSWARDEERANVVCYHLTLVAADEKLSTNPAQVAATYTEPPKPRVMGGVTNSCRSRKPSETHMVGATRDSTGPHRRLTTSSVLAE